MSWHQNVQEGIRRSGRRLRRRTQDRLDSISYLPQNAWSRLTSPARGVWKRWSRSWEHGRTRNLMFGLPALAILVGVVWLGAVVRGNPQAMKTRYLDDAYFAINQKDYRSAEIYLQRVMDDFGSVDARAEFALGEVFEETGRGDRAQWLFHRLAPDGQQGYAPAHRKLALAMADSITPESIGADIRTLHWHLTHADQQQSGAISRAWASYYLSLSETELAVKRMEEAVGEYPELSLLLGELYVKRRDMDSARRSYETASEFLHEQLAHDETNTTMRAAYANTLLKLGEGGECEKVLRVGLKLDPEGPYKQLLASLYTNRHDDLTRKKGVQVSELLGHLHTALNFDPTYGPAYERIVAYSNATADEEQLTQILSDVIAQGKEPGLAHFALALVKWKHEDVADSRWHLERAYELLPEMPFVANNLAWILATEEPTDPDRALELITSAIEAFPAEPRFRDTRATILIQTERWPEAYDDLEQALKHQRNVEAIPELHQKLASVCEQIGQPDLAQRHRQLASDRVNSLPSADKPLQEKTP